MGYLASKFGKDTLLVSFLYRSRSNFWKSNFSKTIRQNFKVNAYSEREIFTLLENVLFTLKLCPIFLRNLTSKKRNGNGTKIERIAVSFGYTGTEISSINLLKLKGVSDIFFDGLLKEKESKADPKKSDEEQSRKRLRQWVSNGVTKK